MNEPQADESTPPGPPDGTLDRALALVEFLRAHCPWDGAQTHQSLRRYLLEEAHEVVDAIDGGNDTALRDELGDLLLNLAFQVVLAEERAAFDREDVAAGLEEKMRRRHPHIYGGAEAQSWDAVKAAERGEQSSGQPGLLDGLVQGTDPLGHAQRIQARAASVGFDWPDPSGAWAKLHEEIEEVETELASPDSARLEEEIGDLLFTVVNLARLSGVHPTTALTRANAKFTRRFAELEARAGQRGLVLREAGLEALDRLWEEVKREER